MVGEGRQARRPVCGREEAIRIGKASVDAIGEIEEFCNAHGIDADFNRGGYLWTATTEAQLGAWDSTVELLRDLGAPALELLEPAEVARRAGSPVHIAGVLDPSAATVQPAKLARGLRRVAMEHRRAHLRALPRDATSTAAARPCCARRAAR